MTDSGIARGGSPRSAPVAISHDLWAFQLPDASIPHLTSETPVVIQVRSANEGEHRNLRNLTLNKSASDDAGTFFHPRELEVDGIEPQHLAVVVGDIVPSAEIDSPNAKRLLLRAEGKAMGEIEPPFIVAPSSSVGIVVNPLEKGSENKTYSVLTARRNGICFPKPLRADAVKYTAFLRHWLPGPGNLEGKDKQLKARQE